MFDALFNDPVGYVLDIALVAVPFLYGIILHELAHGYVALRLGDPTAKLAGRLTLKPMPHIDPMGAIIFFIAGIGWAKPVPVNPRFFKNPRQGMIWVSLAGPATNFAQAIVYAFICHWLLTIDFPDSTGSLSRILYSMSYMGAYINLLLGFFNLLPIPPMDGSNILAGLLPPSLARRYMSLAKYGMVLVILLAVLGLLGKVLFPAINMGMALLHLPH